MLEGNVGVAGRKEKYRIEKKNKKEGAGIRVPTWPAGKYSPEDPVPACVGQRDRYRACRAGSRHRLEDQGRVVRFMRENILYIMSYMA